MMRLFLLFTFGSFLCTPAFAQPEDTYEFVKRVPPVMPQEANRSGYCCMSYTVDKNGKTTNIQAGYCTEDYYEDPSKVSVSKWIYSKKNNDGSRIEPKYLTTKISYYLNDSAGVRIPGGNGFMSKKSDGSYNKEKPCGFSIS